MSEDVHDDEQLDPVLSKLYAAEAETPLQVGSEQRVLAGVLARLAQAPLPLPPDSTGTEVAASGPAVASVLSAKVLGVALLSAIIGGFIGAAIERQRGGSGRHQESDAALSEIVSRELVDAGAQVFAPQDASTLHFDAAPIRKTSDLRKPAIHQASPELLTPEAREAHLIDRARTALRRGLLDQALLTLMEHERTFRTGKLAEERDVLAIETYIAKGERQIAMDRIEKYRMRYPQGFHRKRIERLASEMP